MSTRKFDTVDPRSSEESPALRGGSPLAPVGSTAATTPFKKTRNNKKAVECIPPQGELTEADYDLGVLSCATSRTTIVGQICVPSDDSTLGGYCMDPPPLTYADGQTRLLGSLKVNFCTSKSCQSPNPDDYDRCDLDAEFIFRYQTNPPGTVFAFSKDFQFKDSAGSNVGTLFYASYANETCPRYCINCLVNDEKSDCPPYRYTGGCYLKNPEALCDLICLNEYQNRRPFQCKRQRPAGFTKLIYNGKRCDSTNVDKTFDCGGSIIDMSQDKPFKNLPFIQAKCNTPKPTKAPQSTKAPKPLKTPKPKKPRQLVSSKTPYVDSAERFLIDAMNILNKEVSAATEEDANAEKDHSTLER